jgi:hypothetical protein
METSHDRRLFPAWSVSWSYGEIQTSSVSSKLTTAACSEYVFLFDGGRRCTVFVSPSIIGNDSEMREFLGAMKGYEPYVSIDAICNVFPLEVQAEAAVFNDDYDFNFCCEVICLAFGTSVTTAGPFADDFRGYIESSVKRFTTCEKKVIVDNDDTVAETPSTEFGPLKQSFVEGELVGIEGDYVAKHAVLGGYNPFELSDLPVSQRAVTAVYKMAGLQSSEAHFHENAYKVYLDAAPIGSKLELNDGSVLGESVMDYALRQRFVTWACMQNLSQRQEFLNDYWCSVRNDNLRRKSVTFFRYKKGLDKLNDLIDKALPPTRNYAMKRSKEKAVINDLMTASYILCPRTRIGKGFKDDDLLCHFSIWNAKERDNINPGDLVWPRATFDCLTPTTVRPKDYCAVIDRLREDQGHWRLCRSIFLFPDFFGKFASVDTMLYGKPFTVIGKWGFLREALPGNYDLYGVGSENYFLSVLPQLASVEGLYPRKGNMTVSFFDVDETVLKRFFYAQKGDVMTPRESHYIVSDVEIPFDNVSVARLFSSASRGVAFKVLVSHSSFCSVLKTAIFWSKNKKWRYWLKRCGDQYNGEFIFVAGEWKLPKGKSNATFESLCDSVESSVHEGEHNRRKALMLFIMGADIVQCLGPEYQRFIRALKIHRSNRNYYVANSRATSTYLNNVKLVGPKPIALD